MSVGQTANALKRTRKYVGELQRAGELTVIGSGSKRLFLTAEVERVREILDSSVDLYSVLGDHTAKEIYGRFAEDDVVLQCVRKVGDDYFVRQENVDIFLKRLRALGETSEEPHNGHEMR